MTTRVTLLPSARRLINSLRDIGYDLPNAIADIVDNSVAAGASRVELTFAFDGLRSSIVIADNGCGMKPAQLDEAMRYGTQRDYDRVDLGRFGLGLKTASLSQCRCLTVASRRATDRRRIAIRRWDLDEVLRTDRWEVLDIPPARAPQELTAPLAEGPGTVVMWEGLDRLFDYSRPAGGAARHGFEALATEVREHLAMVFHRFLAGEFGDAQRLELTIDGKQVAPWDPFARDEPHTRTLEPQQVAVSIGGREAGLVVRPYILPQQQRFSTSAAHMRAAGPARWNRQQGLYFYRHGRLVQGGGWNRLRTTDEHTKLARVAVDLPVGGEDAFGLNVAKMRVSIPRELRNTLTAIMSGVAAEAAVAYRGRGRTDAGRSVRGTLEATPSHQSPPMVASLDTSGLDLLRLVAGVLREELADEPQLLRRALGRLDRITIGEGLRIQERELSGRGRRARVSRCVPPSAAAK